MPKQTRSNAASTIPIKAIWETIQRHHVRTTPAGQPRPPVRLSSSSGSAFRDICAVCYEAATGKADVDPERAVKAFVSQQRDRERKVRAEVATASPPSGGAEQIFDAKAELARVSTRRAGQQVKKKRDLAS